MIIDRNWKWSIVVAVTLAAYGVTTTSLWAKGGGHGGGGHAGGHHGGGGHHAGGHHGGEHHANHHPYHPSQHHNEHHASHHSDHHHGDHHDDHHHHVAHHNHHHENWHHGGWGPGYWGGFGAGYAYAPWGWGYDGGGDTYVDNSTNVTPASNDYADSGSDDSSDAQSDGSDDAQNATDSSSTAGSNADQGFPTDDWPELGLVTYAGAYGASQGQVIVRVVPGSAGSKAGLVPGDVILSLNGQPTPSADALDAVLDNANGNFTAEVWDARTGRKSTIEGKLDANTSPATDTTAFAPKS